MNRTSAIRDAWRPQTREDKEAILSELEQILASAHFCNSKRYPALLRYIVERTLAGDADQLKERTLGVQVFDRPPSYDTNADTVVRYTAGEVRKRLSLYYHELPHKPLIQIALPAGSYVPEFLHGQDESEDSHPTAEFAGSIHAGHESGPANHELEPVLSWGMSGSVVRGATDVEGRPSAALRRGGRWRWWAAGAALIVTAALAGFGWKSRGAGSSSALQSFWAPVVRDQSTVMLCTGGSVFSQTHLSGVATAGKDIDYPFISIQSASGIAQLSALLARNGGATAQLQPSATTPLTQMREHPVILLGGYNNQWTLRLLQPLPLHFSPETVGEAIVDQTQPGVKWERDPSLPYSSADDYALVARYRDSTTDGWVIALAGVGRNGTEAAAQFATSPHYLQLLQDRLGSDFANKNVEAVLKVNVIDGKTGAPMLLAVHAW